MFGFTETLSALLIIVVNLNRDSHKSPVPMVTLLGVNHIWDKGRQPKAGSKAVWTMQVHTHTVNMGVCVTEWHSISTPDSIKLRTGSSNWKIENTYFIELPLKVLPWELLGDLMCCQFLFFCGESCVSWHVYWRSTSRIPVIYFLFIFSFCKLDSNSNPLACGMFQNMTQMHSKS